MLLLLLRTISTQSSIQSCSPSVGNGRIGRSYGHCALLHQLPGTGVIINTPEVICWNKYVEKKDNKHNKTKYLSLS